MSDIRTGLSQGVSLHARQDLSLQAARASGGAEAFGDFGGFQAGRDSLSLGGALSVSADDSLAARNVLRHLTDN